jgi:hypothetical protein
MSPIFKRAILSLAEQSMERVHSLDHWPSILLQIKTKSQKSQTIWSLTKQLLWEPHISLA